MLRIWKTKQNWIKYTIVQSSSSLRSHESQLLMQLLEFCLLVIDISQLWMILACDCNVSGTIKYFLSTPKSDLTLYISKYWLGFDTTFLVLVLSLNKSRAFFISQATISISCNGLHKPNRSNNTQCETQHMLTNVWSSNSINI